LSVTLLTEKPNCDKEKNYSTLRPEPPRWGRSHREYHDARKSFPD